MPGEIMSTSQEFMTLHRYFIWADRMKVHFDETLKDKKPESAVDFFTLPYMSYWYGGMYVLIEGWRELNFHDPEVDELLKSSFVDHLRLYRNGVFHFRNAYFDEKRFLPFIESKESATWIRELREAFGRFFLESLRADKK